MKIKKLLVLGILPLLALTSCGRNKIDETNNETPQEQTPSGQPSGGETPPSGGGTTLEVTYENLLSSFKRTKDLHNVTINIHDVEEYQKMVNPMPAVFADYTCVRDCTIAREGNKVINTSLDNEFYNIKISEVLESSGLSQQQFDDFFDERKYSMMLTNRSMDYGENYTFVKDVENDVASVSIERDPFSLYCVYFEDGKQWGYFEQGFDYIQQYLVDFGDSLPMSVITSNLSYIEEIIYEAENVSVSGNTISFVSEGLQCSAEVTFDGEYLSKVILSYSYIEEKETFTIEFIKRGSTTLDFPEYKMLKCSYGNHEYCRYFYEDDPTGKYHIKFCGECEKFIGELEEHEFDKHGYGICVVCGYHADEESRVPQGFEDVENSLYPNEGFFKVRDSERVLFDTMVPKMPDSTSVINSVNGGYYYAYPSDQVVMVLSWNEPTEKECLQITPWEAKIYRNVDSEFFQNLKCLGDAERLNMFKNYISSHTPSGAYAKSKVVLSHEPTVVHHELSNCVTFDEEICLRCGVQAGGYLNVSHSYVSDGYTPIDACHYIENSHCTVCGETFTSDILEDHQSEPIVSYETIDECHRFVVTKCPDCGEEFYVELEHHPTSLHNAVYHPNECTTTATVICNQCGRVVSETSEHSHGETEHVFCSGQGLADYGLENEMHGGAYYEFDLCKRCHKPVGVVTCYFSDANNIRHDAEDHGGSIGYKFDYDTGNFIDTFNTIPHSLDENGFCHICGAKVIVIGREETGLVTFEVRYHDGEWEFDFHLENGEEPTFVNSEVYYIANTTTHRVDYDSSIYFALTLYDEGSSHARITYMNDSPETVIDLYAEDFN